MKESDLEQVSSRFDANLGGEVEVECSRDGNDEEGCLRNRDGWEVGVSWMFDAWEA